MNVTSYQHYPTFSPQPQRQQTGLRFQGAGYAAKSAAELLAQDVKPNAMVKFFKWIDRVTKSSSGEIVNIAVNTLGTGIVAPLVIAYNKFNDEDKHTKIYSAMRQPISAVLTLVTQMGINSPIPKICDGLGRKGSFGVDYLGGKQEIPENASPEKRQALEAANKLLEEKHAEALKDPAYRERVTKLINIRRKDDYETHLNMAKKGRASMPPEFKLKKAAEMTVEEAMTYTSRRLGNLKTLVGLGLSLLTLYPTCALLNWMYPRFMDKFFPQLTKDDKK